MRSPSLTSLFLFLSAVALPACQLGELGADASQEKLVAPPASCNGDPTCNIALDYPNAAELQMAIDSSNAEKKRGSIAQIATYLSSRVS